MAQPGRDDTERRDEERPVQTKVDAQVIRYGGLTRLVAQRAAPSPPLGPRNQTSARVREPESRTVRNPDGDAETSNRDGALRSAAPRAASHHTDSDRGLVQSLKTARRGQTLSTDLKTGGYWSDAAGG